VGMNALARAILIAGMCLAHPWVGGQGPWPPTSFLCRETLAAGSAAGRDKTRSETLRRAHTSLP
ncbi:MAG: hypothetical protein ACK56I_33575, partial [bacterium]